MGIIGVPFGSEVWIIACLDQGRSRPPYSRMDVVGSPVGEPLPLRAYSAGLLGGAAALALLSSGGPLHSVVASCSVDPKKGLAWRSWLRPTRVGVIPAGPLRR